MPGKPACVVEATLNYAHAPEAGERLEAFIGQVPEGRPAMNLKTDSRAVTISDFRGGDLKLDFRSAGFKLVHLPVSKQFDWADHEQVQVAILTQSISSSVATLLQ